MIISCVRLDLLEYRKIIVKLIWYCFLISNINIDEEEKTMGGGVINEVGNVMQCTYDVPVFSHGGVVCIQ